MRIEAKYISQVYPNGSYGLDDFSVEIESGSFVTVLGESGCGKTTLLRVLSGLERYACGELYLDGVLSTDIKLKQRKTACPRDGVSGISAVSQIHRMGERKDGAGKVRF